MARLTTLARTRVRSRLLEEGARQFARAGFERANIDAIALGAGCAKGTIYNYFDSKDALFGEVLSEACRRAAERYAALDPGESTRDRLRALATADVSVLREDEAFMKVLVREAMTFRRETYSRIVQHLGPFLELVEAILARGAERGEVVHDRSVSGLALLFSGTLMLLYVQHWGSGGTWPRLEDVPELAVTAFLDGAGTCAEARDPGAR